MRPLPLGLRLGLRLGLLTGLLLAPLLLTPAALGQTATPLPADAIAVSNPGSAILRRLSGRFPTHGDTALERATSFVEQHGFRFGAERSTVLVPTSGTSVSRDRETIVRLTQRVHGFDVIGYGLVLALDTAGDVRWAHGVLYPGASVPAPLPLDDAETISAALRAAGFSRSDLRTDPVVRLVARPVPNGLELVRRVEVIRGLIPLALELDAHTGRFLRTIENTTHASGNFHYDDVVIPFATGVGKGGAYKNVKAALKSQDGPTGLKSLAIEDAEVFLAPAGSLTGRYCQVVDDLGFIIISDIFDFLYSDSSTTSIGGSVPEYQLFDHANTFAWLTRMGAFFSKRIGDFAADYTVLTFVNYDNEEAGYANAFYTTSDSDGAGGYDPGYFVFGEFSNITGDPMDDLSRDPSIVCHEYVHCVMDKEGLTFAAAPLDTPSRAVNEAVADYFAASYLKTPEIGAVLGKFGVEIGTTGEALRNLMSSRTMPDNLFDFVGVTTFLPQEHSAGVIFGAALWKARQRLKPKAMDTLVFQSLSSWPLSTAEVGFPVVTPANAQAAYAAYYLACFSAMADTLDDGSPKGRSKTASLLGAFMSHGVVGSEAVGVLEFDATEGGLKLNVRGEFLGSIGTHVIDVVLGAGQVVSVSAKGVKGTTVDFAFDDAPAAGDNDGDFSASKPKKVNAAGTKASQKKILVNATRTYRLTVTNTDALGGAYRLSVKVK
jgi:hypothetical protein